MKNLILALIASAVALSFVACEPTTNVKWTNKTEITAPADYITEIYWSKDGGTPDTTWSNLSLNAEDEATDSKTVSELAGQGDCLLDGGGYAIIELDTNDSSGVESITSNSAVLKEGADVNLVIANAKKK